jgi:predicted peptidase
MMIIRVSLTILALLVLNAPFAQAQTRSANRNRQAAKQSAVSKETLALYEPGEYRGLKYRLMKPIDFDATKTYPLILSLHGAGGRGHNNIKTLRNWNEYLADEALRRKHPCFVLAPQSAGSWNDPTSPFGATPELTPEAVAKWPAEWQARADRYRARDDGKPRGNLHIVLDLLDNKLSKDFHIDSDRIYCLGHSMGGAGTFTAIYQHPDRFAAAIPTAGGFPPWRDPARIKDVPIWTFHGSVDNVVPTAFTRWTFAKMKELGGNMKYTELRGVAHGANAIAFKYMGDEPAKGYVTQYASDRPDKTGDVWDWLFKHTLSERK